MDPLTPEQPALRTGRFRPRSQRNTARNPALERRHSHRSGLSASCAWPSNHSASKHLIAPMIALTRYPSASWTSDFRRSGLHHKMAGSPDNPAESSSQQLRTGHSLPVASHPASRRRSYFQLQAGERIPEEDSHLSDQTHLQTHHLDHFVSDNPKRLIMRTECDVETFNLYACKETSGLTLGIAPLQNLESGPRIRP